MRTADEKASLNPTSEIVEGVAVAIGPSRHLEDYSVARLRHWMTIHSKSKIRAMAVGALSNVWNSDVETLADVHRRKVWASRCLCQIPEMVAVELSPLSVWRHRPRLHPWAHSHFD